MALAAGTRLGHYEITGRLGTGGMGEVYRAVDTKLGREVAIKTLPSALAQDTNRLTRFEREAKLLAALNHARIGAIYGLDEHEGTRYLAMELIEGETLDEMLKQGPLSIEDTLHLALQIAEALEAAHEKGIVHRDLKPANIMVTDEGQVKVLDFGLGKALSGDPNRAAPARFPALSAAATQQGLLLGTAGYMSPEQTSGHAADQRADVWAFGVVLYEMLTGLPLFMGESVPDIFADVLKTEPDWTRLPKNLHPRLKLLLERCLKKKLRDRYHSIADARVDIEDVLRDPQGVTAATTTPRAISRRRLPLVTASAAAGAAIAAFSVWSLWPSPSTRPVTRFSDTVEPLSLLPYVTISRDGSRIGYVAGSSPTLFVRDIDEFDAHALSDSAGDVISTSPCFSPDGTWIAFGTLRGKSLRKVRVAGGEGLTLAEGVTGSINCGWAQDGNIYFVANRGVMRVSESGGTPETLVVQDTVTATYAKPQLLPGGRELLLSVLAGRDVRVLVHDLETREQKTVLESAGGASFISTGHDPRTGYLIYGLNGALYAVPFDLDRHQAGVPSQVVSDVAGIGLMTPGAVSSTGTLVYPARSVPTGNTLVLVGRQGSWQPLFEQQANFHGDVTLSPDGRLGATYIWNFASATGGLWVYELDGGRRNRLTFDDITSSAVWTRDGKRLIYKSMANVAGGEPKLQSVPVDGSGPPVTLWSLRGQAFPTSISPDGTVLMGTAPADDNTDVWLLPLDSNPPGGSEEEDIRYFLNSRFNEQHATFSPDGRWVAYSSDESGQDEVYVVPYPGPGQKSKVSVDGGRQPRWNSAGGELFYLSGSRMMAAAVETAPTFHAGVPQVLFDDPTTVLPAAGTNPTAFQYDVTPDGTRFLMLKRGESAGNDAQLRVVQNWFEELRDLAPGSVP